MKKVVGIDIGGTNLRIGIVDEDLNILNSRKISSRFLDEKDGYKNLPEIIRKYINETSDKDIAGVSIGVPSSVSPDRKTIILAPNLKGLSGINLKDYLSNELDLPIILDRDVNNLILSDIKSIDKTHKYKNIIGIYIGTGFGNAMMIDGKIYRGNNGMAGELAHIPFPGSDRLCGCGKIGCVEAEVSGKRLEKINEEYFPNTPIEDIFLFHNEEPIMKNFIKNMSFPIITEIVMLDPELVILSGSIFNMNGFPKDILVEDIKAGLSETQLKNVDYIFLEDNNDKGILGAAISFFS